MRVWRKTVMARMTMWAAAAGLCAGFSAAAWAKKMQPAPDWAVSAAKIPTPSDAKDARAVLLSDEFLITVDDQNHAVERERWAVRIWAPEGRGTAQCMA